MVTDMQSRAARGLLKWTQNDLARISGLSAGAIRNYENGLTQPNVATMMVLRQTFEKHGVEFTADGRGVHLKPTPANRRVRK
jgi:transcriptional regulator with XRE-family HTH domain